MPETLSSSTISLILISYAIIGGVFITGIIRTKNNAISTTNGKVKQHIIFMLWLIPQIVMAFIAGAFLSQQDAAWYQISQQASEIQPERLIIYVIFYPFYLVTFVSAWLYASTRFKKEFFNFPLKLALLTGCLSPFMFVPAYKADLMIFSTDWDNLLYRVSYWLISLLWVVSIGYITARQTQGIFTLMQDQNNQADN